jgi:hypothetical protein
MLGQFLGVGQHLGSERRVLRAGRAAPAGAGDRADDHGVVAQPDQDLRARADQREVGEIEKEQERRRVEAAERPVERERRQVEGQREAL